MGSETCQCTKRVFKHSRKHGPKSLSKTYMKAESKEATNVESSKGGKKHETNKKAFV
jgi:hypothetical protein